MKSKENWPVILHLSILSESTINNSLTTILIVGVMNGNQVATMEKRISLQTCLQIDSDKYVIASVVTQDQLESLYQLFEPLSRRWRGQYQSLTKAFVETYKDWKL